MLADEPPEILEALAQYLELKAADARSEQLKQRLSSQLGG